MTSGTETPETTPDAGARPGRTEGRVADEQLAGIDDEPGAIPAEPVRHAPGPLRTITSFLRNLWRRLTSMRTALVLLFLLAVASLPGALLPQWSLNSAKTAQYLIDHPTLGPWLDRLGFFEVFASPWYAAIYLLLFTSLIGCVLPRSWDFLRQLRAEPVATPRNLGRLPHHKRVTVVGTPDAAAATVLAGLTGRHGRRWRVARGTEPGGVVTLSAERGYLREVGNLVFHLALLGLLVAIAVGKLFGYEGSVLVTVGDGFCSLSPANYDNFRPGLTVDGTELNPFCLQVDTFDATYTDVGQAIAFTADVRYQKAEQLSEGSWTNAVLRVNDPLRINGERVYLLGHGYTPEFTITFPNGEVRNYSAPFQPASGDPNFTSQGAVKVTDPPGVTGDDIRKHQLAIVGIVAPTAVVNDDIMTSVYPAAAKPGVAVDIYRGDLGMESGRAQSVFTIDQNQVDKGALVKQDRVNLMKGESVTLDDGTVITFTGVKDWVSLQTSYDPAQGWALVCAILLLAGLMLSLTIKRRRVWFRLSPVSPVGSMVPVSTGPGSTGPGSTGPGSAVPVSTGPGSMGGGSEAAGSRAAEGRTVVEIGGLARTDQAGYGEEFDRLVALTAGTRKDG